jgi:hypothetical protein
MAEVKGRKVRPLVAMTGLGNYSAVMKPKTFRIMGYDNVVFHAIRVLDRS